MRILNVTTAVPEYRYSTDELLDLVQMKIPDSVVENIRNLGVEERFLAVPPKFFQQEKHDTRSEPVAELCSTAAKSCLLNANLQGEHVRFLVAVSDDNDYLCPGLSNLLVSRLNLNRSLFHINMQGLACSALPKALELTQEHLIIHPEEKALLVISGVNSGWFVRRAADIREVKSMDQIKKIDSSRARERELQKWLAVLQCFLFGDGASAVLLGADSDVGHSVERFAHATNINDQDHRLGYIGLEKGDFEFTLNSQMRPDVTKVAIQYSDQVLGRLFQDELGYRDIDKWIVHTGSKRILDRLADHFKIDSQSILESYEVLARYGNLSGASLPFTLHEILWKKTYRSGGRAVMLGFGWGFSASGCVIGFDLHA